VLRVSFFSGKQWANIYLSQNKGLIIAKPVIKQKIMIIFLKRTYLLEGQLFSHFQEIAPLDGALEKVVVTQMVKNC
jgi:hypothetical protein